MKMVGLQSKPRGFTTTFQLKTNVKSQYKKDFLLFSGTIGRSSESNWCNAINNPRQDGIKSVGQRGNRADPRSMKRFIRFLTLLLLQTFLLGCSVNDQNNIQLLPANVERKALERHWFTWLWLMYGSDQSSGTLAVWERGFPASRRLTASPRDATPRQRVGRKKIRQRSIER